MEYHVDYQQHDDDHPARHEFVAAEQLVFDDEHSAALTAERSRPLLPAALLAAQVAGAAPADRYFGRLNMSALRIRYETMQLRKRYETHQLLPKAMHLLLLNENAFRDWARSYPHDAWRRRPDTRWHFCTKSFRGILHEITPSHCSHT